MASKQRNKRRQPLRRPHLPLLRRQVLSMLFVEQLTAIEIAERLNCPVNYVYKEKHRALQKIRVTMEGDGHDK